MMDALAGNDLLYHGLVAAAIVAAFVLLSRAARALLRYVGRKLLARTENLLDDRILEVLAAHVRPLMLVTGLQVAVRELRKGVAATDLTADQILDYGESLLYIVVVVLVVKILLGILREIIHWYLDRIGADGASGLKQTLGPLTTKVVNILVGMVAVIILLDHFGINIGSLLVSLGVGSLAVALAAQDTLANMIAGFVILVDRPFRVGDRIELSAGVVGDVQGIGLRSTKVLNFDNNVIIIPNAEIVKGRIVNFGYPDAPMRVLLTFEVAYGTDPERVRAILIGLARATPGVLEDPPPQVFVAAMGESSVQLMLVGRCLHYSDKWRVETTIREEAYKAFLREQIEVPYPQRVVHIRGTA